MRYLALTIMGLLFVAPSLVIAGPIYVYKDADGATRFSSKAPPRGVEAKVFTAKDSKFSRYSGRTSYRWELASRNKFNGLIARAALRHRVNAGLVKAVIHAESAFNPRAISPKGALGLMQLMPENCRRYGVRNPFSVEENINAGARMLADLHRKYRGDLRLTLAAYNAGEAAVEKFGGVPPFPETREYVRRVLELRQRYQGVL